MAEERRIQLAAEVDTTRTREGFQEIGQQAGSMAAAVTAAGERADRGLSGVGAGAGRVSAAITRAGTEASTALGRIGEAAARSAREAAAAERNLVSFAQRTAAAMDAGARSGSAFVESLARVRGIDPTQGPLAQIIAQIRELEVVQRRATNAQGAGVASMDNVAMSARATAAALRGVPAQLTDIITSLQGGQAPLTVFLQQGGQLRDMFGSASGAARALGGYVVSLVTPLNVAAAAVVALGVAYHQGSQEAVAYSRALILSGNAAGTTSDQLSDMARSISKSVGTQGAAAEALAALVGTGRVSVANLQRFGQTAVSVEKAIGQSAADTAAIFTELGDAPLKASEKLNQQYRYLTASIYDQIAALQDQGRMQEAGEAAQKAYADAMDSRSSKLVASLGLAERAWAGITGAAKGAWDAMLDVGRAETLEQKLAAVQAKIAKGQKPFDPSFGGNSEDRGALKANLAEEASLRAQIDAQARLAGIEAGRLKLDEADIAWKKEGEKYLSRELQLKKDIALIQQQGLAAGVSDAEIAARVGEVRKKYADIAFKSINDQIDAIERRGGVEEEVAKRAALAVASAQASGIATSLAAQISYAEQVEALDQQALAREKRNLQQKLALVRQLADTPENRKAQADLRAEIDKKEEQSLTRKVQLKYTILDLDTKDSRQAAANLNALAEKRSAELQSLQAQVRAQEQANGLIGKSTKEVADYNLSIAEQSALLMENKAAIIGANEARKGEAADLMAAAQATRALAMAQREGVLKAADFEEQKQFWGSVERTAHDTFISIADGSKSAAQRLKDSFKNIFFDWLYSMTLKKWLINVSAGITGQNVLGNPTGMAGGAGGAGQLGSLLQVGKGVFDAISTGFTGLTASLGTGLVNLGGMLGSSSLGAFGAGLGSTGMIGAADAAGLYAAAGGTGSAGAVTAGAYAGAAVTAAAGIAAGVLGGRLVSGGYSAFGGSGNSAVNIGTAIGTAILPGIGSLVGGLVGGATNRLFGYKPKEYTSQNIVGMLDSSGFSGDTIGQWTQKGGLFRSNKSGTDTTPIDAAQAGVYAATYEQLKGLSGAFAKTLGADISSLSSRSQAVRIAVTKDKAENEKAITDFFAGVADSIARELVPGLEKFQAEGESSSAALQRLAGSYQAVESVITTIGRTSQAAFGAVGLASIEARERLIAAAGGIDALASGTAYFAQNFLTPAEQMAPIIANVEKQLSDLGLASVKSNDEFKKATLGIDLSTQAGADLYAKMLQLAPQFKQMTDYTESLTGAMAASAASMTQRADLQKQLDQAAMTDAEKARAAIEASNLALYDSLQARLAEKSATEAAAQAMAQSEAAIRADIDALVKASLPVAEQRKLETAGMAASTLALYERREALQAEAKAVAEAKAAADALANTNAGYQQQIDAILKGRMSEAAVRALETKGMAASTLALYDRLKALQAEEKVLDTLKAAVATSMSVLAKSIGAEKEAAKAGLDAQLLILNARKSSARELADLELAGLEQRVKSRADENAQIRQLAGNLKSALDGMRMESDVGASRVSGQAQITQALALARVGTLPAADSLSDALAAVSAPSAGLFDSFEDYARDFYVTAGKIADLNDLTGNALTKSDSEISLAEAQIELMKAEAAAQGISFDREIKLAQDAYTAQIAQLDQTLASAQAQLDATNGTTVAVMSVANALTGFRDQIAALAAALKPAVVQPVGAHAVGGLASGWSLVGEQGPELVNFTQPGRVYTASQTANALSGGGNSELVAKLVGEVQGLREEVRLLRTPLEAIERSTDLAASVLDQAAHGGQPLAVELEPE